MSVDLICCCGVGGTGKTVTARAFVENNPAWHFAPSVVRDYYASRGVASEIDYLQLPPEGRYEFQLGLLSYYVSTTEEVVAQHPYVVMDRSIYDHMAYSIYADPGMSLAQLRDILAFGPLFERLHPVVAYFPYPASWTETAAAADGFRATDVGKNFAVDALMRRLLSFARPDFPSIPEMPPYKRATHLRDVWARQYARATR